MKMSEAGKSIIKGALEALEFAQGKENGCVVHVPDDIKEPAGRDSRVADLIEYHEINSTES